ncbi:MAG: glycosyltransferase family 39 protein [Chloroflexota bacterium]
MRQYGLLLSILIGFLVLGGVYNHLIPPFEGPDEAQHFAYVVWFSRYNELPPQGRAAWDTRLEQEASQPPFYYFLASLPMRLGNLTNPEAVYRPNPHYPAPLPHPIPDNENRAVHYGTDTRPLRGEWLGFYFARGLTLIFGLFLLVGIYGLGRQVMPTEPGVALGAVFLTAVTPQVLFLSTMVSNDIPAAALSTLALWLFALLLRRNTERPFLFLSLSTGLLLGLAGLTKVSALGLMIPFALGFLWLWRSGQWRLKRVLLSGLWLGVGVTAVSAWWFIHNWVRYGSPVGLDTHEYAPWGLANEGVLAGMSARWLEVARSFWLALGWGALRPADWVYTISLLLAFVAFVGLIWFFVKWRQGRSQTDTLTVVLLGVLIAAVIVTALLLEIWMRRVVAVHGRLLFPALGAVALLLVMGWRSLHPKLPWLGYSYSLVWALAVPLVLLKPAYTPAYLTAAEIANLPALLDWQIWEGDQPLAVLKQLNLPQETAVAGSLVPVELCWQALAETETDYSFLIQIIGPENSLITSRRTYPGHGLIPTSDWAAGTAACETTHLLIPQNLPETLLYQVEVAFIDHDTEIRLPVTNAAGAPLSPSFAAPIRLETSNMVFADNLSDEPVQLLASEFAATWTAGEETAVSLSWTIPAALEQDYQVFVHLRDAAGKTVAQADGPPLAGWYPTSWWTPGEIVTDERRFPVPADLPPGVYSLAAGFYDLESGARFGSEFMLGQINVVNPGKEGA